MEDPDALASIFKALSDPTRLEIFKFLRGRSGSIEYDAVYCLGDLGGYASQPNEVQEAVMSMGCPTIDGQLR